VESDLKRGEGEKFRGQVRLSPGTGVKPDGRKKKTNGKKKVKKKKIKCQARKTRMVIL